MLNQYTVSLGKEGLRLFWFSQKLNIVGLGYSTKRLPLPPPPADEPQLGAQPQMFRFWTGFGPNSTCVLASIPT